MSPKSRNQCPLQFKLNELFDGFGLQKTAPPQQQESKIQPIAMEK
jgi:hypothetical protein